MKRLLEKETHLVSGGDYNDLSYALLFSTIPGLAGAVVGAGLGLAFNIPYKGACSSNQRMASILGPGIVFGSFAYGISVAVLMALLDGE